MPPNAFPRTLGNPEIDLRLLNRTDLARLLDPKTAEQAARRAFRALANRAWRGAGSDAFRLAGAGGEASWGLDEPTKAAALSAKIGRERQWVLLMDDGGTRVLAVLDGRELREIAPSASASVASKALAVEGAKVLGLVGTGAQARRQLRAGVLAGINRVLVAGRTEERAQAFVAEAARGYGGGIRFEAADVGRVAGLADILCLCTDSETPVLLGNEVRRGCHINATGATEFDRREVDTNTVLRSKVVIEDKELGITRAGDLRIPVEEGKVAAEAFRTDLADVVAGRKLVRLAKDDITLFKSVGHPAVEFYLALTAYEAALERKIGTEVDF